MNKIAIYGSGGFGKEVCCLINKINEQDPTWDIIGFFDDMKCIGEPVSHYGNVLGGYRELNNWKDNLNVVIAVADPVSMQKILSKIDNNRIVFPNIIHPDFSNADSLSMNMGQGNIIARDCFFSCNVTIGDFNIFNASAALGHDVEIGSYNMFMPMVRVSGNCTIGNANFFGVGSIVLQRIKICNKTKIGAGSVVMTKPKAGELYMGNPAKLVRF